MLDVAEPALGSPPSGMSHPTLGYAPSTFLERGVWVPFTTPALEGTRVRPGERDHLELIVANPSGGRGVYILAWEGVFAICAPTVHDRVLAGRLHALRGITPTAIRRLALDAAGEGLAGREAASAATVARDADRELVTLTNFALLLRLIEQTERTVADPAEAMEARAKRAVASVAAGLGRSPEDVAAALEELAALYAPFGLGPAAGRGRVCRGSAALHGLRGGVTAALRGPPVLTSADADLVVASVDLTLACLRGTVADALGLIAALPALLQRWRTAPGEIAARLARPDWLLDGWDRICLAWDEGGTDRDARFAEIADLIPAVPREASAWADAPVEAAAGALRLRRRVRLQEDWRTGAALPDLVARNERFRALAPGGLA